MKNKSDTFLYWRLTTVVQRSTRGLQDLSIWPVALIIRVEGNGSSRGCVQCTSVNYNCKLQKARRLQFYFVA